MVIRTDKTVSGRSGIALALDLAVGAKLRQRLAEHDLLRKQEALRSEVCHSRCFRHQPPGFRVPTATLGRINLVNHRTYGPYNYNGGPLGGPRGPKGFGQTIGRDVNGRTLPGNKTH